ncbi:MAG TPA: AAA family ATPase [Solirubrobacteraceae bacterium]|nr:AAA family ATPase [Solirubrobacteraceae bacterium]
MRTSRQPDEPGPLLERDEALGAIDEALRSSREGRGCALIISGPPGIGKTRVLDATVALAKERDLRLLRARGAETETAFPFAGALQLLERAVDAMSPDHGSPLVGSAALARPVFEGRFLNGEGGPVNSAIHGLFWLTVNLSAAGPLALLVDDLHALDEPTLAFLLYLQRRIDELPVALIAATRPAQSLARPALSELVFAPGIEEFPLSPLSPGGVAALVRDQFDPGAQDSFCDACARVSGGSPFLLQEALRALRGEGVSATGEGARRLADVGPQAIARAVLLRLGRLDPEARVLARAVAVLGDRTSLSLAAELAELPVQSALRAADALVAAAILESVEPASFTHALIRTTISADMAAGERAAWNLRAAELLQRRHAPVERIAPYLLNAPPGDDLAQVEILAAAAAHARETGIPSSATAYLRRALQEPVPRGVRAELLLELARVEMGTDPGVASAHLAQARALGLEGVRTDAVQLALGRALYAAGRHEEAAREFLVGVEAAPEDSELGREASAWFCSASLFVASLRPRAVAMVSALALAPPADPTPAERAVLAQLASFRLLEGAPLREVRPLVELAWGAGELLRIETCDGYSWMHVTAALHWGGDSRAADGVVDLVLEDARRRGSVMAFATASYIRASAALFSGRLVDALAEIEQTLEIHRRDGWTMFLGAAQYVHAEARLERGELQAAEAALSAAPPEDFAGSAEGAALRYARGRLRLAQKRPADAVAELRAAQAEAQALGINPPQLLPLWDVLADALTQVGEPEAARQVLAEGEAAARRAELPGILARMMVARARYQGRDGALATLREAVEVADAGQARLEQARARVALGMTLRRAGQRADAVGALRPGLELAHRLGAVPLEALAREELAVLGARPRRSQFSGEDALTPSERRTARLAADGMTNREIAEALFVTPKTVEYHLRNVFMKLDIASRRELRSALDLGERTKKS